MSSVAYDEQETVINFSRRDNEATVWTSDTTVMTKLDGLCEKSEQYVLVETGRSKLGGEVISKTYKVKDKSLISFRAKKVERQARPMTDEQRQVMIDRLAKARQKRAEKNAL
jgi:hypothetical protein